MFGKLLKYDFRSMFKQFAFIWPATLVLAVINHGFHAQTAAPGYAMCYAWGIRHLEGDPWKKTRIDDPEHAWLWKPDANDHIFQG